MLMMIIILCFLSSFLLSLYLFLFFFFSFNLLLSSPLSPFIRPLSLSLPSFSSHLVLFPCFVIFPFLFPSFFNLSLPSTLISSLFLSLFFFSLSLLLVLFYLSIIYLFIINVYLSIYLFFGM